MSRQKSSLPWDLLEAALLSLLAISLTMLPHGVVEFGALLGILLVVTLPGYAVVLALFPRASDLAIKGRILLSLGASAIISVLAALCLTIMGRFVPSTLSQALAIISLALIAVAYLRWASLPSGWRFIPNFGSDMLPGGRRQGIIGERRTFVVLVSLAAIIIVSAFAYTNHSNTTLTITSVSSADNNEKKFTEFYILDETSQAPIEAGSKSTIMAGIVNREHRTVDYTLKLVINGSVLSEKSITLNRNKSWEGPLSYTIGSPVNMQRLDLLLYKDNDFQKPYDERNIWINVSGGQVAAQKDIKDKSKYEAEPKDQSENGKAKLQHDGGSAGEVINSQNAKASSIDENRPEVEENKIEVEETKPSDMVSNTNSTSSSERKEQLRQKTNPENLTNASAVENNSSEPPRINTSGEIIALNFSTGIKTMNASDIYQEDLEANENKSSPEEQENNRSLESSSNNSFNESAGTGSFSSNIDQSGASMQSENDLSVNKPIVGPISIPQKFYTRPRPGSANQKGAAVLETAPASNTAKPEVKSESNNSINKAQSTAAVSGTDKSGSYSNQQITSGKTSNKSSGATISNNVTSHQINKNINISDNVNKNTNKSANSPKNASLEHKTSAPQDDEAVRMAEMSKKIDSWVSTRGMKPSNSSSSYKSDIIQFNSANNSVVLGGQSAKTKKIG